MLHRKCKKRILILEQMVADYRKTVESIAAVVDDNDIKIIELLSRIEPDSIKLNKLPDISITLIVVIHKRRPARKLHNILSNLSNKIELVLSDYIVAPTIETKYGSKTYVVSIKAKYRGIFEECCGAFHTFLEAIGLKRAAVSMNPKDNTVVFECYLPAI